MININRVSLKPAESSDIEILYLWFSGDDRFLWTNDRTHYSFSEFCESFHNRQREYYYNFMVIRRSVSSEPVGFIYAYNYQQMNGFIYTTCYIKEDVRNFGIGALAVIAYYDMWFREHPIIKICNEVFEYNQASLSSLTREFHLDGVLRRHRYYNGRYYDLYHFSILREEFYTWFNKHINSS